MGVARRLYLYSVSLVALAAVGAGIQNLLSVVLASVIDSLGSTVITEGGGIAREQTSLAIAMLIVGGPVWLIHWWLAERGARGSDARAAEERASSIRAFHLSFVRAVSILIAGAVGIAVLSQALVMLFGDEVGAVGLADALALLLTAVPAWAYHSAVAAGDVRGRGREGGAGTLTRLYMYGTAFWALAIALFAAGTLVDTAVAILAGQPELIDGSHWWRASVAGSIVGMTVGLAVWLVHWRGSQSMLRDGVVVGDDERSTRLRATYLGAVLVLAAAMVGVAVAAAIAEIGRWLLGLVPDAGLGWLLESVVGPPLAVVPFLLAGWFHARARAREATLVGADLEGSARRVAHHLVALVGLAFLVSGAYGLLALILDRLLAPPSIVSEGDFVRRQLPWFVGQAVVGAALWVPAWTAVLRRRSAAPDLERRAGAARAYLYLVVGVALISAVAAAVFVLFRLIDRILGGAAATPLDAELATPVAILAVAGIVAAYHGRLVLGDVRAAPEQEAAAAPVSIPADLSATPAGAAEAPVPAAMLGAPITAAAAVETLGLVLRGPAGSDLSSVAERLRERLPAGVTLEGA